MNLSKKIKTFAVVSFLAISIPAAGIAYASPGQLPHMNTATQQVNKNASPVVGMARQSNMTLAINSPKTQANTPAATNNTHWASMPRIGMVAPNQAPAQLNSSRQAAMTHMYQSTNMASRAGYASMSEYSGNHAISGGSQMGGGM